MTIQWSAFADIIHANQSFVLTSHIRPDCDALGSELGMAAILRALGKDVRIVNGQGTPPSLTFIDPPGDILVVHEDIEPEELVDVDVLMVLDTSAWAQLGPMGEVLRTTKATKVILDHHVSEDDLGATAFKDSGCEATGRLVIEAAEALGVPLNQEMATPLFAAIATDTGWFRFPSTTDETYEAVAKLVRVGARPADIYGELYERDTMGRIKLRGLTLSRITAELDGALAHTYVLKEDFENTGALPSDTEDLVNQALSIAGTKMALIFIGQLNGGFKVSFRSRCKVDCSELSSRFGGGGHRAAAGAFVDGDFEGVRKLVLDAVREAMR